jgi:hypothetical protein
VGVAFLDGGTRPRSRHAHALAVRAWDTAANTQPATAAEIWNFKGYMNNAWHRITLHARA